MDVGVLKENRVGVRVLELKEDLCLSIIALYRYK